MNAKDRILNLLRNGFAAATNDTLASEAGVSIVTVDNCLRELEGKGQIKRLRRGRGRQVICR